MSKALGKITPKRVKVAVKADGTREIIEELPGEEKEKPLDEELRQVALPKIPPRSEPSENTVPAAAPAQDDAAVFRRSSTAPAPSLYKKY